MAQSVVYADLKFAAGPSSTVPDDDDSPYENVPLGPVTAAPSPAGLLLLLVVLLVAVVALAACYWQVSRSLQDTARVHESEQGRLSQELRVREQSLEQTQLELAWAREELQRAWHDGNISQMELKSRNAELGHTQQELAVLQEAMQVVQGRLNVSESTVSTLRACMNSGIHLGTNVSTFVNNMNSGINCTLTKFANDTKLRCEDAPEQWLAIQRDLDKLQEWRMGT
ncbi:hypothetical protein HGM15179_017256 [Zosterops borbonicus]|uniref:Uncharacterized protein n=1 Tax=Zosterops borbonicus TaxID=364589 RepID=A0A8K1LDI9_9PASS|nr:hypothetical protein HGM15179_017256 [Zosterops borbonicus]